MRYQIIKAGIKQNKSKSFLILFCLSISIGMIAASTEFVTLIIEALEASERIYSGNSDIVITNGEIDSENLEIDQLLEYKIVNHNINVNYKDGSKLLRVFKQNDLTKIKIVEFELEKNLDKNNIIVNENFLKEIKQDVGDRLSITIRDNVYIATIAGTFKSPNQFTNKAYKDYFFTTYEAWEEELIYTNYITMEHFFKVKEEKDIQTVFKYLKNEYQYVKLSFDQEEYISKYEGVFTILTLVSISIAIMGMSIIYTTKKLLILLDSRQYAIIRSVGANKHYLNSILLMDGIFYGIISGLFGTFISNIFSYTMLKILLRSDFSKGFQLIDSAKAIHIIIIAIIVSCGVNLKGSKEIRNQSIKNVLSEEFNKKNIKSNRRILVWIMLLILNVIIMIQISKKITTSTVVIFIIFSIICFINILPQIAKKLLMIIQKPIHDLFGNTGYLSIKNLQNSNSFSINATTLTISFSIALLINSSLTSIADNSAIVMKENLAYDIIVFDMVKDKEYEQIMSMQEIESGYQFTDINNVEILEEDMTIYSVDFIHDGYDNYRKFNIPKEIYQILYQNDKKMILSEKILSKLGLQPGDTLKLKILEKSVCYEIVGSFTTAINNGDYAIVSDNDISFYTETYFKLRNKQNHLKVTQDINNILNKPQDNAFYVDDYIDQQISGASNIYEIIRYISIIPIIVSIVITLINGIFSFYENRKSLLIFRSLGMSENNLKRIFLLEQLISTGIGCICGVIIGNLLIEQVKKGISIIHSTMYINQSIRMTINLTILTIIFSILSVLVLIFTNKSLAHLRT